MGKIVLLSFLTLRDKMQQGKRWLHWFLFSWTFLSCIKLFFFQLLKYSIIKSEQEPLSSLVIHILKEYFKSVLKVAKIHASERTQSRQWLHIFLKRALNFIDSVSATHKLSLMTLIVFQSVYATVKNTAYATYSH